MSSEMRGSLPGWKEGELGTELELGGREETEGLRELGRDVVQERGDPLVWDESARRRNVKGRRSFKLDFWVFFEAVGDRRMVGVERTLEGVESGEMEGESGRELLWSSSVDGTGCAGIFVTDCGSSARVSLGSSMRSLLGSGRGAKRMRRVERAEDARWRSRYELEEEEEEERSVCRPGRGVDTGEGEGEGEGPGEERSGGRRRMEDVIVEGERTRAIETRDRAITQLGQLPFPFLFLFFRLLHNSTPRGLSLAVFFNWIYDPSLSLQPLTRPPPPLVGFTFAVTHVRSRSAHYSKLRATPPRTFLV